jgi:hypothetical protein
MRLGVSYRCADVSEGRAAAIAAEFLRLVQSLAR